MTQPATADAITATSDFGSQNFALVPVTAPGTYALVLSGLLTVGEFARRKKWLAAPPA